MLSITTKNISLLESMYKKRGTEVPPVLNCEYESHEVGNLYSSVVHVSVGGESLTVRGSVVQTVGCNEWIADHTVTSLEANLRLEGVRIDRTNHLEGNVWAIEETSVIR